MQLTDIFNIQNGIMLTVDVLLFAWMHFTPEGMLFGAGVADMLGMTSAVGEAAGMTEAVTSTGAEVFTFE